MSASPAYLAHLERRRIKREQLRAQRACSWLKCPTCPATYRDDGGEWCPACRPTDDDG
jgi:hypothetical protein